MRKHLFLPILIILSLRVSYSQNFEFVKTLKGKLTDNPADMVISKKGNIYFTGFFNSDTLNIGSCTLYNLSKKKSRLKELIIKHFSLKCVPEFLKKTNKIKYTKIYPRTKSKCRLYF